MVRATPNLGRSESPLELTRRKLLGAMAVTAASLTTGAGGAEPLTRRGTPQLTMGPFYPLTRPAEEDADLTTMSGVRGRAQGTIIDIIGRVTNEAGVPVPGAFIDIWQTNSLGRYHHPKDPTQAPWDPAFQGAAVLRADAEGRYRLRTVLPAPYASRQRHIHFDVRGRNRRLITQMFFPGEPNERDDLYSSLRSQALQAAVTARLLDPVQRLPTYEWNIALAAE